MRVTRERRGGVRREAGARTLSRRVAACIGLLVVACVLLVNLERYPAPWFDEGIHLSAAALLARDGVYGLPDSRAPRIMDTALLTGVGPPVVLPVAAVFWLFGTELLYARLLVVGFALLTVGLYWHVARRLFDKETALVASLCLLAGTRDPFSSFVYMSRQVLGEVPALGWLLLGLALTLRGQDRLTRGSSPVAATVAAGLAWGALMTTKTQMALLLPVTAALVCLADVFYYRQGVWRSLALSVTVGLACVGIWVLVQVATIGPDQFALNAEVAREGLVIQTVGFRLAHLRNAAGVIWRTGFLFWGLPGVAWGLWLGLARNEQGFRRLLGLSVPLLTLIWFAASSIGWSRYAFLPFALLPIWTSHALLSLLRGCLAPRWRNQAAGVAIGVLVVPLAVSASSSVQESRVDTAERLRGDAVVP